MDPNLRDASRELAQLFAEEEVHKPQQMLSQGALEERYQKEIEGEMVIFSKKVEHGLTRIVEALQEQGLLTEDVIHAIKNIGDKPSDAIAETLYQGAKWLFEQRLFDDAADAFVFLTSLKPDVYAFWLGLGNSEYGRKHFKEALWAYERAGDVQPTDPICHIISSRCYQELGEQQNAINALDKALQVIQGSGNHVALKQKLEQAKNHIKNQ